MSPKTGVNTPKDAACVNIVPRAMADGLTGGRSIACQQTIPSVMYKKIESSVSLGGGRKGVNSKRIQSLKPTVKCSHC